MLVVEGLRKTFGNHEVLKGVSVTVKKGEVVVIIGPSGSGKTTLLRCLNVLEIPDSGTVTIDQERLHFAKKPSKKELTNFRRLTRMVFQSYNLFPHMTALENVMEIGRASCRERV